VIQSTRKADAKPLVMRYVVQQRPIIGGKETYLTIL
jgi:hypothetical protein